MQFVAPSICLLSGQGAATVVRHLNTPRIRRIVLGGMMAGLIASGIAPQVVSFAFPYRMLCDHQSREFARWFWPAQARNAEVACAHIDHGIDPPGIWQGRKAWYLCNQVIYSPSRRASPAEGHRAISPDHPLRCVVYGESADSGAVRDWLARMPRELELRATEVHHVELTVGDGKQTTAPLLVFEFVPRNGRFTDRIARRPESIRALR